MFNTGEASKGRRRRRLWVIGLFGVLVFAVALPLAGASPLASKTSESAAQKALPAKKKKRAERSTQPNIVLIVFDDLSMDLVPTLRSVKTMRRQGASYPHSFVVDSLCCVSRASTFTGQYPHQTGVRTNVADPANPADPQGGWKAFESGGNTKRTVALRLQDAGYTTGFVGKYLNQYEWQPGRATPPVPPGWTDLRVVFGSAYDGWDFYSTSLENGQLQLNSHPAPPADASDEAKDAAYAGTVIADEAMDFLDDHADDDEPYFLQVSPYAPHSRVNPLPHYPGDPLFPPAFGDRPNAANPGGNCGRLRCEQLTTKDLPGFGDPRRDNRPSRRNGKPGEVWNTRKPLRAGVAVGALRNRARMAQSADRMIQRILRTVADDTYVVLTSDNGMHLGQQGLAIGKGTAYSTDSQVPLYVVGPGVQPGTRREIATNVDLASTFERMAGLKPARYRSGRSLTGSLEDPKARQRDYVFFEHTRPRPSADDPDWVPELAFIPSYVAVRGRTQLLIRYDLDTSAGTRYVWEFYDLAKQGFERTNVYGRAKYGDDVRTLRRELAKLDTCATVTRGEAVRGPCRKLGEKYAEPMRGDYPGGD